MNRVVRIIKYMVLTMLMVGLATLETRAEQETRSPMTPIFMDQEWYRNYPMKEQTWEGTVKERVIGVGPGDRAALTLALKIMEEEIPLYTAGVEEKLQSFLNKRVTVIGKLVDLQNEGFGFEIWIGAIGLLNGREP